MIFFSTEIWNIRPSGLNQRIIDAAQQGIDAKATADSAASSASSNNTTITATAFVLGFNSIGLLLTAVGSGAAYTTIGATVAGLSTTVAAHTCYITDLNRITRYMSTSILIEEDYTIFNSAIKICGVTDIIPNVY